MKLALALALAACGPNATPTPGQPNSHSDSRGDRATGGDDDARPASVSSDRHRQGSADSKGTRK